MRTKTWGKLILILATVGLLTLIDLPKEQKEFLKEVPLVGETLADLNVKLGLDLQGGTHLDYRVITEGIPEADVEKVVAGVKEVIERRVNKLGVSEPNIFTSKVGEEDHIIVELAGIKDIEEARAVVGKTIQLEFKEQQIEADPEEKKEIQQKAKDFLDTAKLDLERFEEIFADFENKPKITLTNDEEWIWVSDLPANFQPLANLQTGEIHKSLIEPGEGEYFIDSSGGFKRREGSYVVQLLEKEVEVERTIENEEERRAAHVLISYTGADRADEKVTRTALEAKKLAEEIFEKAKAEGASFADLAKEYSDGPTGTEGGDLGFFKVGQMDTAFNDAVFLADGPGLIDEVIETPFGFHIIKLEEIKEATTEKKNEDRVKLAKAFFNTAPDGWQSTGLTGQHFRRADVGSDPTTLKPIVNIYFTQVAISEQAVNWWQLVWYIVALIAGVSLFSAVIGIFFSEGRKATARKDKLIALISLVFLVGAIYGIIQTTESEEVTEEEIVAEETAEITNPEEVSETDKAGVDLFAEITGRNLQKPLAIFLDGLPIIDTNRDGQINELDPAYAPIVQSEIKNGQAVISGLKSYEEANELVQNLNTGAIPAPIKLVGQFTVGATLGHSALVTSLQAGLYGLIAVVIFMILFYRLPGIIAGVALAIYGIILIFVLQILGVVLTLAGVAGVILSIGMAVDANILIFERLKEELALGKSLARSVEDGFARAWSSIRDSNVSSIITCVILYWFGSSIIQGFALTLCVGILVSMFSAITVTRTFLRIVVGFIKSRKVYGAKELTSDN